MKPLNVLIAVACIAGAMGLFLIPKYNNWSRMENRIEASYTAEQGFYSQFLTKLQTAGVVAERATEAEVQVITSAIAARYGEGGSQAVMQWLTEQNSSADISLYREVTRIMDAGYSDFQARQETRLDQIRTYKDSIDVWPAMWAAMVLGFNEERMNQYDGVLMSVAASADFDNGTMSAPSVFGNGG